MKYLKMLGLAAVAAGALMAFVGAGTASADFLCTANETPCSAAHTITKIESSLVGGTAKLETTEGTVLDTCTGGTVVGNIEESGAGKTVSGKITSLTWSGCTNTTTTIKTGKLDVDNIAGGTNGTVTGTESEVTVNGIFGVSCVYGVGAGTDLGTLQSGANASLTISAIVNKTSGGFACPSDTRWTAEYRITNHSSVFVHNS
jgi:hypothetical protein